MKELKIPKNEPKNVCDDIQTNKNFITTEYTITIPQLISQNCVKTQKCDKRYIKLNFSKTCVFSNKKKW